MKKVLIVVFVLVFTVTILGLNKPDEVLSKSKQIEDERNCDSGNKQFPCVDKQTGYMWSQRSEQIMRYDEAVSYCRNLNEGGFSDWYLPSVAELETIGREGTSKFGDVERFWSSTQWYLGSTDSGHWDFEFSSAYSQHMTYNNSGHYVRCVRGEISMLSTILCKIPILQPISLLPITTKQNHKIHLFIDKMRQNCHDF